MYSIENISVLEYFQLEDTTDYDIFIETINAKNIFNGHRFDKSKLTFDEVEILKGILQNPTMDNIKEMFIELFHLGNYDTSADNEFNNTSVFDLFRAKKYIQDYIVKIVDTENKVLAGVPDDKLIMINAGEKLKAVSHLLTKMRLAEQFGKSPNEIGNWKYNTVFSIMLANKLSNDVQREYQNIK
jgi:hypothetical protein